MTEVASGTRATRPVGIDPANPCVRPRRGVEFAVIEHYDFRTVTLQAAANSRGGRFDLVSGSIEAGKTLHNFGKHVVEA